MMIDNAFPVQLGGGNNAIGFLRQYLEGRQSYEQAGEDIPDEAAPANAEDGDILPGCFGHV